MEELFDCEKRCEDDMNIESSDNYLTYLAESKKSELSSNINLVNINANTNDKEVDLLELVKNQDKKELIELL